MLLELSRGQAGPARPDSREDRTDTSTFRPRGSIDAPPSMDTPP